MEIKSELTSIVIYDRRSSLSNHSDVRIYFSEDRVCKTEADARESAELLKQFFEAKEAGKVARLVVEEKCTCGPYQVCGKKCNHPDYQRPKNTVIDQMNDAGDKATAGIGMLKDFTQEEIQEYKSKVNEYYAQAGNAYRERREAFKIAKLAALIFAHNTHDFDERRAVQSAAKILKYAQERSE